MTLEQMAAKTLEAQQQVIVLKSRNVDPGTIDRAVNEAATWRSRYEQAKSAASFTTALDRTTDGLVGPRAQGLSLGAQFVNSSTFAWLKETKNSRAAQWSSPASELLGVGGFGGDMMATTISGDPASGGDLVITDYQSGIRALPTRPLTVADLMAPGTTTSNAVGYMKETSVTNAAAPVAEGAAKPESTIVFNAVIDPVRKIATWIPVTDEMFEDVPALSAYLDTRLRLFVLLAEDDQLLNGSGTPPALQGILSRAGIATPIARTTETNADVILKQMSAIETAQQLVVDGVVMHPSNWDSVILLKDADGRYIAGGGPLAAPGPKTLWGRNVALTTAVTVNTAVVGAWKTAAQFFRRGGIRVEATNSHSDFFTKNLVAVRSESRGALAVYREGAFGKVTNLT